MTWGPVTFDPHPGGILNVASGLLLFVLAGFVACVKPRRRANIAFAGFSAGWGLATVVGWTLGPDPGILLAAPGSTLFLVSRVALLLLFAAAMVCLVLVALWFPRSLSPRERPFVRRAGLGAGAFGLLATGFWLVEAGASHAAYVGEGYSPVAASAFTAVNLVSVVGRFTAFLFALFLLALRAGLAHREGRDAQRRQYVLMTVALVLHAGALDGIWASVMPLRTYPGTILVPLFVALCALSALWLSHTRAEPGHGTRAARNVALLVLALPVSAWALFTFLQTYVMPGQPPGLAGGARTLTVLVLAYAILRHQLLGMDVKLRWGISRSTVAGAFVAVFFVASEGAQIVFGQGNEWVGLLAAGALVFAIAPLQRAADRLAARAIPVGAGASGAAAAAGGAAGPDPERAYRNALRLALKDRRLTRDEEVHLAELAEALGIGAGRAAALVREIEEEREREVVP